MRPVRTGATQNHLGIVGLNYIVEKCFEVCGTRKERWVRWERECPGELWGRVNTRVVFELQRSSSSLVGLFLTHRLCEGRGAAHAASFSPGTVLR